MNQTCSIPESIRDRFDPDPAVAEHSRFFAGPSKPILGADYHERLAAVRQVSEEPAAVIARNPAFGFALEAQMEALEDVLDRLGRAHPASFREIARGHDLLENLQILLAGGPAR
ncbi:MAG: hypothetical protein ACE5G3_12540 [Gammaproteobacteria bacterium]